MNEPLLTRDFFSAVARASGKKEYYAPEEIRELMYQFREIMMMYDCAIREVRTKAEVLNEEFQVKGNRNPISTIKSRVKDPMSIFDKLKRKNLPMSISSILDHIHDVAGVRIICPFIEDIYAVADMLTAQDDIIVLERKDYIQNPKSNGYRSLHLVIEVPVFLSDRKQPMKAEVQIRTIAMDFWASLEHQIHYKQFDGTELEIIEELKECADVIFDTDMRMQNIQKQLEIYKKCQEAKEQNSSCPDTEFPAG